MGHKITQLSEKVTMIEKERFVLHDELSKVKTDLKKFRENKEKLIFCFFCSCYAPQIYWCKHQNLWVNSDRYNRITITVKTEEAAYPRINCTTDHSIRPMEKFAIDERTAALEEHKEQAIKTMKEGKKKKWNINIKSLFGWWTTNLDSIQP